MPRFDIVKSDMFQNRHQPSGADASPVHFSEKDREDAARLLTIILGEERTMSIRSVPGPIAVARAIFEDRRRRALTFNPGMFGEPAWELLLTLYVMDIHGPRLTIGALARFAGCAPTTTLRWLDYLEDQQLIYREEVPGDARTSFVRLFKRLGNR